MEAQITQPTASNKKAEEISDTKKEMVNYTTKVLGSSI
ncbi:hypothetical protein RV06_GL001082 [Enterococcus haemoperoxidus]|nr:hypothetical protein RV06_GL001082 [Enterococcus haemoperoxidus]